MKTTDSAWNLGSQPAFSLAHKTDEQLVELINQLQSHHHAAFNELTERYRAKIYRRCRLHLGCHSDGEDATQIILQRVYEKLHLYRGEAKFSSWLNRIIDNQCANYYHAHKRHRAMHESCDSLGELHDEQDHQQQLEDRESVNKVLDKMTSEQSEILRLRFYLELSLNQIAEKLGISLSATKARLYRSLEKFQCLYHRLTERNVCAVMH